MANPTPKTSSTRVQLPVGLSGAEPPNAPDGGLAYATDTEVVRVKTSTGWEDVGGGGAGTITEIDAGTGIAVTAGTGPVVTVATDLAAGTGISISGTHPQTITATGAPPTGSAGGDLSGTYPNPNVAAIHETSGPTKLTVGNINDFQLLQRVGSTVVGTAYPPTTLVGDVSGLITANKVNKITETSGPTTLTIGSIADTQYLVRSGSTLVGTSSTPPTGSAGGDLSGTYPNPNVAAIHETSGPTQLTIGAISTGQVLIRSGSTVIGSTAGTPTGNPFIDPPVSAGTLDDEFDTGSADLAVRGWTVKNSAGTTMTRVGDIAPWNVGSLTAAQYNSTLIGSVLHIEFALGTDVRIYKAISWASGSGNMIWARLGQPQYRSGATTQTNYTGVSAWYSSGGNTDGNNRVLAQISTVGTTAAVSLQTGRVTGGVASITSNNSAPPAPDILGIKLVSGTTSWDCFAANSQTGSLATDSTGTMVSTTMAFAGLNLYPIATTGAATTNSQIFTIDFIRSASGASAWIGQTPRPVAWNVVNADITNYSTKTTPVAADQVYIADSAASNAIKRATLAAVKDTVAGGWDLPSYIPARGSSAFNDEFDSGSADLATRGWTCVDWNTGTTMTRRGNLEFASATGLAANQYNSELIGSTLFIQTAGSQAMFVYQTVSATDKVWAARMTYANVSFPGTYGVLAYDTNRANGSAPTNEKNGYFTRWYDSSSTFQCIYTNNAGTQVYNNLGTGVAESENWDILTVEPSKRYHTGWSTALGTLARGFNNAGGSAVTVVQAGFVAQAAPQLQTTSGKFQTYVAIDWIRRSA